MTGRLSILFLLFLSAQVFAIVDFSVWDNCPTQCHGDVDCSGYVNTADLQVVINIINVSQEHPVFYTNQYYDATADIDRNFQIDNYDLEIMQDSSSIPPRPLPQDCGKKLELGFDGDYIAAGSTQSIEWQWNLFSQGIYVPPPYYDNPDLYSFSLYYDYPGSGWIFIGSSTGTGPIQWQVPNIDMQECRLRIVASGLTGLEDISSYFTIYPCQLDPEMDVDHDCIITLSDYTHLAANWLAEPGGKDMADLCLIADFWLACGNPYDSGCVTIGE